MTKADKNFKELCTRILEEGYNTKGEKVRPKYADGTPSHTYFVNQVWEEYDLQKGEFPILTLRHIAWKSSIKEILWIYQDQTNGSYHHIYCGTKILRYIKIIAYQNKYERTQHSKQIPKKIILHMENFSYAHQCRF